MALTLRMKTILAVTLTLVVLIIGLFFITRSIVLDRFSGLEEDEMVRNVERFEGAINNELLALSVNAQDNALPDTFAETMKGLFENYETRIITRLGKDISGRTDLLVNLMGGVNVALLTDSSGNIIWGWSHDDEKGINLVPASLRNKLTSNSPLLTHPDGSSLTGVVALPEGHLLVASEQFVASEGGGQFLETLLLGKYLDEVEVARLEELTELKLDVQPYGSDQIPTDFLDTRSSLSGGSATFVTPLELAGGSRVAAYSVLADIDDAPALLLRVDQPRDIINEGKGSITALLISVIVVGVVLVILIAFLLNRLVLSRLARLDSEVGSIHGGAQDLSQRVMVQGNDELSRLGTSINGMLGDIQVERQKSEDLLLNVLPVPIANRLKEGESTIADSFAGVSVLFSDVVGFTKLSGSVSATQLVGMLNGIFSGFDTLTDKHGLEKIKTIGDAYMVVAGLPDPREDHAEAIAEMALEMYTELDRLNKTHGTDLEIRVGINSGPVVAGSIGTKKFSYDLWGDTVNTAARMESHGVEGRIHVTEDTYNMLRDKYDFEDRGIMDIKGKGDMRTFLLKSRKVAVGQQAAADDGEG